MRIARFRRPLPPPRACRDKTRQTRERPRSQGGLAGSATAVASAMKRTKRDLKGGSLRRFPADSTKKKQRPGAPAEGAQPPQLRDEAEQGLQVAFETTQGKPRRTRAKQSSAQNRAAAHLPIKPLPHGPPRGRRGAARCLQRRSLRDGRSESGTSGAASRPPPRKQVIGPTWRPGTPREGLIRDKTCPDPPRDGLRRLALCRHSALLPPMPAVGMVRGVASAPRQAQRDRPSPASVGNREVGDCHFR